VTAADERRLRADVEHLLDVGRYDQARTAAARLLATAPQDPDALCLLAQSLVAARDGAGAEGPARQAVALAPDREWGYRLLSIALLQQGRPADAVPPAEQATSLDPGNWQTWTTLASAATALGDHPGALRAAREAVRLAPHRAHAHFVLGQAYAPVNQWAAGQAYREALALDPADAGTMNGLAALQLRQGRTLAAADGFARTGAMDPKARYVRFNLRVTLSGLARRIHRLALAALAIQAVAVLFWDRRSVLQWAALVLGGLLAGVIVAVVGWRRAPPDALRTLVRALRAEPDLLAWTAAGLLADLAAGLAAVLFLALPTDRPGAAALVAGAASLGAAGGLALRAGRRQRRDRLALGGTTGRPRRAGAARGRARPARRRSSR
jgi:Flp pilus assembly protein TadD